MKSLLQTKEWAKLRESQGWRVHWVENILVLEKPLPMGLSFLYVPEVDFYKLEIAKNIEKIKEIAKKSQAIFIRLDILNKKNSKFSQIIASNLKKYNFIKAFEEIQPEYSQITDITKSDEQILTAMKPKGRYNIRVAQKNQVTCTKYQESEIKEGINIFYDLFKKTASRDGFGIRPKAYFEKLMEILSPAGLAELLVCSYNGKPVAAGIFTFYDEMASYLYGASSSEARNVMAPYLMHWEAIKLAKEKDCKLYDLLAISPFGENPNQKLVKKYEGITRFKEQFGGRKVQTFGSWDLVTKPLWYNLFKMIEKMRRR